MKYAAAALLALCVFLLAACGGLERHAPPSSAQETVPAVPRQAEPEYQLESTSVENTFASEDGIEVARYTYQLLTLTAVDQPELSGEAAKEAARIVDAFNDQMMDLMEKDMEIGRSMGEFALSQYDMRRQGEIYYYDETSACACILGQVVSVRLDNSAFTGGAHPNRYVSGYLFDLRAGQFINPIQVADAPEAFRTGAAAVLLEKLEAREDLLAECWPEYPEILSRWNEGTVLFDGEGMAVVFSPYELGPYSMGEVELRLSYEELEPLVGEGGLVRLGAQEPAGELPPDNREPVPLTEDMRRYKAVLQGEEPFFSTDAQQKLMLSQLNQAISSDSSVAAEAAQLAVLDLDGDGAREIVLRLTVNGSENFGFEILRYHTGTVYGYTRWYRGFRELKEDGWFSFSGGAADTGCGYLRFDGEAMTTIRKAESRSGPDENGSYRVSYFVDGESATEMEYSSAMGTCHGGKQDAAWYDFTEENLDKLLQ